MYTVALIGDSPLVTSGFGGVMKMVTKAFLEAGDFDVAVLGLLDTKVRDMRDLPYRYQPVCLHDQVGHQIMLAFLQDVRPDIVFMLGDPGSIFDRSKQFDITGIRGAARSILYFPIEGLPIAPNYAKAVADFDYAVTYCKFGMEALDKEYNLLVDWHWHGMDHGPFVPPDPDEVNMLRDKVGWTDKFIVCQVGVNKRTNRYPVLVKAMGILLEKGYDDIFMYLHTSPYDTNGGLMAGWSLGWMIDAMGARDKFGKSHILFPPEWMEGGHIYRGIDYKIDSAQAIAFKMDEDMPPEKARALLFSRLGYISRLGMVNLYMDVASTHGFNLPLGEAMCCGVPGVTVDDGFARSEIYVQTGAAYPMKPSPTVDYWHTGAELSLVDVDEVVDTILKFYHDSLLLSEYAVKGREFASALKWASCTSMFVEAARKLA